jgi:2-oxoglutarate dehydrogenase E2 component (dihydrolipoamide succinyltransferase)/2-oxoisovalerate dehydrogenase E2 component (dihydrolipoyl transacylase)
MQTEIIMPQLGESIAEGTVIEWLIPVGGRVEKDQSLLEVETDKVALEIPSPSSGFLTDVLIPVGQTVPVGTVLAHLNTDSPDPTVVSRVGGVVVRQMDLSPAEEDHYSPAVKQIAREHGVDLSLLQGSGGGGRITKKDVLDYIAQQDDTRKTVTRSVETEQPVTVTQDEKVLPLTAMRKMIAERMVKSRHTSAHVVTVFEADFSAVAKVRENQPLTYLPFVIHAVARAIRDFPVLNSSWGEAGIIQKRDIHVGIAVALEDGLLVPVVKHADRKRLTQLGHEVTDLAERARTKKLNPEEVQGGTFTITNHGGFGSLLSTPIIHQPQIAILGVGAVQKRTVVINEAIAIRPMAYLSLSFDHRVIDGARADSFMKKVKSYIEQEEWGQIL